MLLLVGGLNRTVLVIEDDPDVRNALAELLSGVLMVGMFASAVLSGRPGRAADASPATAGVMAAVPLAPTVLRTAGARSSEVSAADLWSAYTRDRVAADRSYRDQSLVVSGTVRAVDRNYEGEMVVRLATPDPFESVNATFASRNDPAVVGLAKGRVVSLLCLGRGALIGAPQLGSCSFK